MPSPEIGADMQRREFITLLGSTAATWPLAARAQQRAMPVIGFLGSTSLQGYTARLRAFAQGLKEEGYIEGQNVAVEYRWAEDHDDRLPVLAAELVHRRVTVIAAGGSPSSMAAKAATATIPIVFETASDPVTLGLVASLNRPGGNLTDALVIGPYLFFNSRMEQLGALSLRHAVPAIFTYRPFVAAGGLLSYGANETESYHLLGIYTGKILKGANPGDLPVQRSTKVELIINLKTAKALGIAVPLALSGRADELIE